MSTQICENCEHKKDECYCSPNSVCLDYKPITMVYEKTWKEFKDSGFLWFINMILHTFGWCICIESKEGKEVRAFPARTKLRGFNKDINTDGYIKISNYMKEHVDELLKESMS